MTALVFAVIYLRLRVVFMYLQYVLGMYRLLCSDLCTGMFTGLQFTGFLGLCVKQKNVQRNVFNINTVV